MIFTIRKEKDLLKVNDKFAKKYKNTVFLRVNPFGKKNLEIVNPRNAEEKITLGQNAVWNLFEGLPKVMEILEEIKKGNADGAAATKRQVKKATAKVRKEIKQALKKSDKDKYKAFASTVYMLVNMTAYNNKKRAIFVLYNEENEVSKIIDAALKDIFKYFEIDAFDMKSKDVKKLMKLKSKKRKKAIKKAVVSFAIGEEGEERLEKIKKRNFALIMNLEFLRRAALGTDPAQICTKKYMKQFFGSFDKKNMKKFQKSYKKFRKAMKGGNVNLDLRKDVKKLRDGEAVLMIRFFLGTKDKSVKSPEAMVDFMKPIANCYKTIKDSFNKAITDSQLY